MVASFSEHWGLTDQARAGGEGLAAGELLFVDQGVGFDGRCGWEV